MHTKSLQSCPTLCDPMDCSPPACPVHGILQTKILERVAMPFSRGSSRPRDGTRTSYVQPTLAEGFFTTATAAATKSLQSCPTLCDPIDGSPPGSPVPGILQARTLEWVANHSVQFSRSVMSDSLQPHESQHARPPCPSPTPGVHPDSRPLSQ